MQSRLSNSKRNLYSGLIKQVISILLPFFNRTAVLYLMGDLYCGLGSLFSSILQVLSLAELGFSAAVIYILYKPIAEENWDEVSAIMHFLKKTYKEIGFIVAAIGLSILPFLKQLITGDVPNDINIYVLYLIYLVNSVISYFAFAYKNALLIAMQRNDIVTRYYSITTIFSGIIQLIVLLLLRNYYLYICILPVATVMNNLLCNRATKRLFPYINYDNTSMQLETKKELNKQIRGIVFLKVGDVARNSFDNIILSSLLGLTVVTAYNNYYYIFWAVYGVSLIIVQSIQASVGNSIVTETVEKNYSDLREFTFVYTWFTGWCTVCMIILFQPFMNLWLKGNKQLIFTNFNMVLFCVYFYVLTINNTRNMYLNGCGLYWECRLWYLVEALANLILNVILGKLFGVSGIIIATIITVLLFNFLTRNKILFAQYFKVKDFKEGFYKDHLIYVCVTIITCILTNMICRFYVFNDAMTFLCKGLICLIVPNVFFWLAYHQLSIYKESKSLVIKFIHR